MSSGLCRDMKAISLNVDTLLFSERERVELLLYIWCPHRRNVLKKKIKFIFYTLIK